ncbi:tyrosine-type recombinase/integrase [Arcobacter aquimarinus]|uniref:tyrosine-type recombinase/integrase n=1 Tax=Arcobacter aquimarinus TaxID=1315211 RepID=UPI003BB1CCE4
MTKTKFVGVYVNETIKSGKVYYIKYKIKGKSFLEKVGSDKEGITAAYASKLRAKKTSVDRLKDDAPMLTNQKQITFDEAFNLYIKSIEGKSDTENTKSRYINHVKPVFGHLQLDDITSEMIEDFRNKSRTKKSERTKRPYAAKTINDWINILGTTYNFMINKKDLKVKNPAHAQKVEREKVDNDRERYLEPKELQELWKALEDRQNMFDNRVKESVTEYAKVFLALSLSTGARLRSVLTITKADINLNTNTITIKNHKSNRTYVGYLHTDFRDLIVQRMEKLKPIDYLVSGTPVEMSRVTIAKVFKKILDELFNHGLDEADSKRRVVIHTFRHTFASLLAIEGTPIYTIMKLMDHADISQTIRYAKLSPDSGRDNVLKLRLIN